MIRKIIHGLINFMFLFFVVDRNYIYVKLLGIKTLRLKTLGL